MGETYDSCFLKNNGIRHNGTVTYTEAQINMVIEGIEKRQDVAIEAALKAMHKEMCPECEHHINKYQDHEGELCLYALEEKDSEIINEIEATFDNCPIVAAAGGETDE